MLVVLVVLLLLLLLLLPLHRRVVAIDGNRSRARRRRAAHVGGERPRLRLERRARRLHVVVDAALLLSAAVRVLTLPAALLRLRLGHRPRDRRGRHSGGRPHAGWLRLRLHVGVAGELGTELRLGEKLIDVDGRRDLGGPAEVRLALLDAVVEDRLRVSCNFIGRDEETTPHEQRLERTRELARRLEALAAILRQRLHHDLLEVDGVAPDQRRGTRDVALLHLRERVEIALHAEETLPRRELPEHDAEREDVGPPVDALAVHLLRAHVRELALERARARVAHARAELRDAEVDDLRDAVVGHEQVVRSDVAMNETELLAVLAEQLVRGVEAFGGVGDDTAGNLRRHRGAELLGAPHHLAERLAVEVLHRDPVGVLVLAEVEHRGDVGVRDARSDARLVEEHLDERLVLHEVGMDLLDRDPLLEAAGAVHACKMHGRHAADADLVDDAVPAQEVRTAVVRADVGHGAAHGRVAARTGRGCGGITVLTVTLTRHFALTPTWPTAT